MPDENDPFILALKAYPARAAVKEWIGERESNSAFTYHTNHGVEWATETATAWKGNSFDVMIRFTGSKLTEAEQRELFIYEAEAYKAKQIIASDPQAMSVEKQVARQAMTVVEFLKDERPKIQVPGDDRPISDFAQELAGYLQPAPIFNNCLNVVRADEKTCRLIPMDAATFCSTIEKHVLCFKLRGSGKRECQVVSSLKTDDAVRTLKAPQFKESLRQVKRVMNVRLPIRRPDGTIELLPEGYDAESLILTMSRGFEYEKAMSIEESKDVLDSHLREFKFVDGDRSKAVALCAMLGLYCQNVIPEKTLRPIYIFDANAEGAGKTMLIKCCMWPALGHCPTGTTPTNPEEFAKVLLTAIIESDPVIFFDNLHGHLKNSALEAFATADTWKGRILGVSQSHIGENNSTVFISSNGLSLSPDMRRRSLVCQLHQPEERAEDRVYEKTMSPQVLTELRPKVLAALFGLLQYWQDMDCPMRTKQHSSFPEFSSVIGGILTCAGYADPFAIVEGAIAKDRDAEDMKKLAPILAAQMLPVTVKEIIQICRENNLFAFALGEKDDKPPERKDRIHFGRIMAGYKDRSVGGYIINAKTIDNQFAYSATQI